MYVCSSCLSYSIPLSLNICTATIAFENFGEAGIEKLMDAFALPFLRRAAILCVVLFCHLPSLHLFWIWMYANTLSGWCARYGYSHASAQLNCGILLDCPAIYRLARLPLLLDSLFNRQDKALVCHLQHVSC